MSHHSIEHTAYTRVVHRFIQEAGPRLFKGLMKRAANGAARVAEAVAWRSAEAAAYLRMGPGAYARHHATVRASAQRDGSTFANGVTTSLTLSRARAWHRLRWRHLLIVIDGDFGADPSEWMRAVRNDLRAEFLISDARVAGALDESSPVSLAGVSGPSAGDLSQIWRWMHSRWRRWDLLLLNAAEPLPTVDAIVQLQHAAYEYHNDQEIGFVVPAYRCGEVVVGGFDVDRGARRVVSNGPFADDYAQNAIPRYTMVAGHHGFYVTSRAVDTVLLPDSEVAGKELQEQVSVAVRQGWRANVRTLCLSNVVLDVTQLPSIHLDDAHRRWLYDRPVVGIDGRRRVIFVLNATSLSGGIRIVFEVANGLRSHGFDVEIWSLQADPDWFDLAVPLRTYRSYDDLLLALRNVDAIKVATWWETAEVVWLASVNRGIPVYLIQEFETWFYPDDPVGRAAVAASYRREFLSITEATFQQAELAAVGVDATLIPNGYDETVFRPLDTVKRDDDSILALGRSFFQKNLAMTVRAWRSLDSGGPRLVLFGSEPGIVQGDRVEYHERPSDSAVNELYNRATVFVQTSRHEGFCLPILEAMAAGCPVITTDSHGNRDFCVDGENCVVIEQDDDIALAAAITRLLADPDERARLSSAGLATAERYRWSRVIEDVAGFYRGVA